MTTQTKALKLARQLLWRYRHETPTGNQPHMICQEVDQAFEQIDEALAQPEQEPVALPCCGYADASAIKWNPHNQVVQCHNCGQIYTTPPQRKPLTDKEIAKEVEAELTHYWNGEYIDTTGARDQLTKFARAIEAAHGIKE